jgi:hypothetical protein
VKLTRHDNGRCSWEDGTAQAETAHSRIGKKCNRDFAPIDEPDWSFKRMSVYT